MIAALLLSASTPLDTAYLLKHQPSVDNPEPHWRWRGSTRARYPTSAATIKSMPATCARAQALNLADGANAPPTIDLADSHH